ncbi:MAG TPA: arsinothricin resistance N-acetyltransferase ArsN1 family B [Rhodothermales bacterium]|nr:arsinothricin resistance N-acetyltransferase ArsN1 family B [Rhodothermales bacterium]
MPLRLVTPDDAAALVAIYTPSVRDTAASFETEVPTAEDFAGRVRETLEQRPWLVAEDGGVVLGYAYAGPHRARAAYAWAVEPSIYVAAGAQRRGVARALYTALFDVLRAQGYGIACAGITLPNGASVALHEAFGFKPVGVFPRLGYKHGRWHDVGWWTLDLHPPDTDPPPPRPLAAVIADGSLDRALEAGGRLLT